MANGKDQNQQPNLFEFLNPSPPQGFFGNFGAGVRSGLGSLGVSAQQTLPALLLSDEADLADIGVASFLTSLGAPIAQRQTEERERREAARTVLPALLPYLKFEERERAAQALSGVPDLKLEPPVLTEAERLRLEATQRIPVTTLEGAKAQLAVAFELTGLQGAELSDALDQAIPPESIERERRRLQRGEELEERQVELTDLQIKQAKESIFTARFNREFQMDQRKIDGFFAIMSMPDISFATKTGAGIQYLKSLGMQQDEAEREMGAAFPAQIKREAEQLIYDKLVQQNIPFEQWSAWEKQLARAAGYTTITEEDVERIRRNQAAIRLSSDQIFAREFLLATKMLDSIQSQKQSPEETDIEAIRRLRPGEADRFINILQQGGVFGRATERDPAKISESYSEGASNFLKSAEIALDLGDVDTAQAFQEGARVLSDLAYQTLLGMVEETEEPTADEITQREIAALASNPKALALDVKKRWENAAPSNRPSYESVGEILDQMSEVIGQDVSSSPEHRTLAREIASTLIPQIPTSLRGKILRLASAMNVDTDTVEQRFRERYMDAFTEAGLPPSRTVVASDLIKYMEGLLERQDVPGGIGGAARRVVGAVARGYGFRGEGVPFPPERIPRRERERVTGKTLPPRQRAAGPARPPQPQALPDLSPLLGGQ